MKVEEYEGKTLEEILEKENLKKEDIAFRSLEEKKSLFKGTTQIYKIVVLEEVAHFIKDYLKEIITLMGIEVNIESNVREGIINLSIHSDQNPLLIGKRGKTLEALKTLVRQKVIKEAGMNVRFSLDIGEYKKETEVKIKSLAKRIAREVKESKVEAKLDPMNSFERRIVHTVLTDDKYVFTESTGEEPNRCIIIKPKEK